MNSNDQSVYNSNELACGNAYDGIDSGLLLLFVMRISATIKLKPNRTKHTDIRVITMEKMSSVTLRLDFIDHCDQTEIT